MYDSATSGTYQPLVETGGSGGEYATCAATNGPRPRTGTCCTPLRRRARRTPCTPSIREVSPSSMALIDNNRGLVLQLASPCQDDGTFVRMYYLDWRGVTN